VRVTSGTTVVSVAELRSFERIVAYRIVRSDAAGDPALVSSFRSHYELGERPRKVERRYAVIHMGISIYLDEASARVTAQRFPRLGRFLAQLALTSGNGFNYARTGHPLHLTLWGDPIKLSNAIVGIDPVGEKR
jgi:hypothetical protein